MWEIIELSSLAAIPAFLLLAMAVRAQKYVAPKWWKTYATAVTAGTLFVAIVVTEFWASVFSGPSLIDGTGLGIFGGAAVGILVYEFIHYWYHRSVHRSDFLWKKVHQMHHAPESFDAFGAYFAHPLDTTLFATWASLVFYPLLGLKPEAGILAGAFLGFNALFQHANIRTPRWLGYIIERPESHSVHHQRHHHRSNYSDLPLWDIVFGTFDNPVEFASEVGLTPGASKRLGSLLIGRDLSQDARFEDEEAPDTWREVSFEPSFENVPRSQEEAASVRSAL